MLSNSRKRRSHGKSRNGCQVCKQRRIKCDELKPNCGQCQSSLRRCYYVQGQSYIQLATNGSSETLQVPSPPDFISSQPASPLGTLENSPNDSSSPTPPLELGGRLNNCHLDISDDGLYRHFLEHAPKFVQGGPRSIVAVQNILSLATQSGCGAIYRSLLALSAACLCCDLIVNNELNLESVRQVLSKGLQHHNYALEQMRSMISRPEENNAECIVSNCIWLFPFAFAFQSINHWLQCRTDSGLDPHSVNPRDAIMLLRGLQATLSVQYDKTKCSHFHQPTNSAPIVLKSSDELTGLSRKHPMFPIITATSHHAFDQLEQRIRLAQFSLEYDDVQLLFCEKAFDILNGLRISIFTSSEAILDAAKYNDNDKYKGPESLRMNIPDWLQAYAMRKPTPSDETEPLSRTLFHFFHVVPQGYLDILFPLLEKDSELAGHDTSQQTVAQYLAIEIYAYWLVLLLLIEQEAWWVGSFPAIGLQGLIKNYGAHLLNNSDFGKKQIKVKWWPKSMFEVMTNIKDWK